MNDRQIKEFISNQVLSAGISDKGLETSIRNILFDPNNQIDWQAAYDAILHNMPEYSDVVASTSTRRKFVVKPKLS